MTASDVSLPSDVFLLRRDRFYAFLESTFNVEIKELARLQGFSSAYSLLHSDRHLLDLVQVDSNNPNLITIKRLAAFYLQDGTWSIKPVLESALTSSHCVTATVTSSSFSFSLSLRYVISIAFPFCSSVLLSLFRMPLRCYLPSRTFVCICLVEKRR
jgi:hypothetical protein